MKFARASFLALSVVTITVATSSPAIAAPQVGPAVAKKVNANQPLRDLAQPHDLAIGSAVDLSALANDPTYRETLATEFDSVTAENVMKWETLEPQRGEYNFAPADELIEFAGENEQSVRGHTLVWHNQNPDWLTTGDFSEEELRRILKGHIQTTVKHFEGKVWQWDVVNEAIGDDGQLRDSIWLRELGPSYIADAFRWANEADPKALLYINDYSVEDINPKSNAYYELVKGLLADGVPIDGFGVQGHHSVNYAPTSMQENLRRFDDLGLATAVTEADVRMPMPSDSIKRQAQANVYSTMLTACVATPRCISFTVWGFTDKYSWVPSVFVGQGAANIFDESFEPKPAFQALQSDLALLDGPRQRKG